MKGSFQKKGKTAVSPATIYRVSQVQKNQTLESDTWIGDNVRKSEKGSSRTNSYHCQYMKIIYVHWG